VSESKAQSAFLQLQDDIFHSFGELEPAAPVLRCRNATQTSVVLEWDPIEVATADIISLSLFRNGQKAGNIPRPAVMQSTKISGLAVDTEYTFHLVLRTSAGTFSSEKVSVKTHKMTDLSGITVTPGILPAQLRDSLAKAVERIGAKMADTVRIDTTHFVTTEGRGMAWEKAVELNIPVVRPEWVEGCERGGRIVGVRQYYLDADPRQRNIGQSVATQPSPVEARKDAPLPKTPAEEQRTNGTNDDGATSRTVLANSESKVEEEEDDGDSEDHTEPAAEQKVRVEDMERHKVMLSPTRPEPEPASSKNSNQVDEADEAEADRTKTSGDASFQDVAL
jgi:chitin biosynthesis protein CHS5